MAGRGAGDSTGTRTQAIKRSELKQRLAAILVADVAGYTRLMAADERATVAALDKARTVIRSRVEANQGRIIDMAGDSALALFDTATGAVQAAIEIQKDMGVFGATLPEERRMRFRVGVHLGDVILKPDGSIYGDGVNIAARLEALAEPGGITISDGVRGAVRGKVAASFVDQGEQHVKNIDHPVRAYALVAGGSAPKAADPAVQAVLALPDRPSIAVLPFANISGDPQQEYFADGMVEDIITELSRFQRLFVISRNTSFTYKGRSVDVKKVAQELGVHFVLEGSVRVRRAGRRPRAAARQCGQAAELRARFHRQPVQRRDRSAAQARRHAGVAWDPARGRAARPAAGLTGQARVAARRGGAVNAITPSSMRPKRSARMSSA